MFLFFIIFILSTTAVYAENPKVQVITNQGEFMLELYPEQAPITVENFLNYVEAGFYDGLIFHRVIKDFVAQAGGFTQDFTKQPTNAPITNEADNGLKNTRGTIAMARTSYPHSATAQFFINVKDNNFLNFQSKTSRGWGYTVFGSVIEGMEVIDTIATLPTTAGGPFRQDVPKPLVVIESMRIIKEEINAEMQEEALVN